MRGSGFGIGYGPAILRPVTSPGSDPAALRRSIRVTARVSLVFAAISTVIGLGGVPIVVLTGPREELVPQLVFLVPNLLVSAFVASGMFAAMRFRSYGLALSASVVSMVPWSGMCMLFSMAGGIACFAQLVRPDARGLFPPSSTVGVPKSLPLVALFTSGFGFCVFPAGLIGAGLGTWLLIKAGPNLESRARRQAVAAVGVGAAAFVLAGIFTVVLLPLLLGFGPKPPS